MNLDRDPKVLCKFKLWICRSCNEVIEKEVKGK